MVPAWQGIVICIGAYQGVPSDFTLKLPVNAPLIESKTLKLMEGTPEKMRISADPTVGSEDPESTIVLFNRMTRWYQVLLFMYLHLDVEYMVGAPRREIYKPPVRNNGG